MFFLFLLAAVIAIACASRTVTQDEIIRELRRELEIKTNETAYLHRALEAASKVNADA